MSESSQDKALRAVNRRQWLRVLRASREAGCDPSVQGIVQDIATYGLDWSATNPGGKVSPEDEIQRLRLRVRQLVANDSGWMVLKHPAWRLFRLQESQASAADLVETVFLYGTVHETADVIASLHQENMRFYDELHDKLRSHLVFRLWQIGKTATIEELLSFSTQETERLDIERFFRWYLLKRAREHSGCYLYFKDHADAIERAVRQYGSRLRYDESRFLFDMGSLSVNLGFVEKGRQLLERIRPDSTNYGDAIQILMVINHSSDNPVARSLFEVLEATDDWSARIKIIAKELSECQQLLDCDDPKRPALNEVVATPLKWVPQLPAAWAELSLMLCRYFELSRSLPGIFDVFKQHILKFYSPALDAALWHGPLNDKGGESRWRKYFHAVALLHHYFAKGDAEEALLWQAKQIVVNLENDEAMPLPLKWKDLQSGLLRAISRASHLGRSARDEMSRQVKVSAHARDITLQDVSAYVSDRTDMSYEVLAYLESIALRERSWRTERRILLNKVNSRHYTNADLANLWRVAVETNACDLAWRAATVLESRGSLSEEIVYHWSISGEKRSEYPVQEPSQRHLEMCLHGLSKDEKKLCHAILKVGARLPELMAALDCDSQSVKVHAPPKGSFEERVEQALGECRWLRTPRKVFRLGHEGIMTSSGRLPEFMENLPDNFWSYLFLRLSDRLGMFSWGWKLSQLHAQCEGLLPNLTSQAGFAQLSVKVAKWFRSLQPEQKSAWKTLTQAYSRIEDQRGEYLIAAMVAKVALLIYPAHNEALHSLRAMGVPVSMIWQVESWILSEEYERCLKDLGNTPRIAVPKGLRSIQSAST